MAKGYTTEVAIENYILEDIDASFSSQITEWIGGIEKMIDQYTGRNFIADAEASARLYDGDDTAKLLVDDCIQVTKVEVGLDSYGTTFQEVVSTNADRYVLYPSNYAVKSVSVTSIELTARTFPGGWQNNRITAKWGYSTAVPDDIKFVATVFVAGILNQNRQGGDEIKTEKIGNYAVTYNTDRGANSWGDFENAMKILDSYKKLNI